MLDIEVKNGEDRFPGNKNNNADIDSHFGKIGS